MLDGMKKNMERVSDEVEAYRAELAIIRYRLKQAVAMKKFLLTQDQNVWHITTGIVEEWFDQMPRVNCYLWIIRIPWRITVISLAVTGLKTLL